MAGSVNYISARHCKKWGDSVLKKIEEIIIVACNAAITINLNLNIILRHIFNMSWSPTEEVCLILVVVFTFIGSAYATRTGAHLFASFLFDIPIVSIKFKKVLATIISLISGLTACYIVYLGIDFIKMTFNSSRTTAALGIPFWTFYLALPIGFVLIAWESFSCLLKNIRSKDKYYLSSDPESGGE